MPRRASRNQSEPLGLGATVKWMRGTFHEVLPVRYSGLHNDKTEATHGGSRQRIDGQ
jgi:hypothetical protein